jgi:hypothetical protein
MEQERKVRFPVMYYKAIHNRKGSVHVVSVRLHVVASVAPLA